MVSRRKRSQILKATVTFLIAVLACAFAWACVGDEPENNVVVVIPDSGGGATDTSTTSSDSAVVGGGDDAGDADANVLSDGSCNADFCDNFDDRDGGTVIGDNNQWGASSASDDASISLADAATDIVSPPHALRLQVSGNESITLSREFETTAKSVKLEFDFKIDNVTTNGAQVQALFAVIANEAPTVSMLMGNSGIRIHASSLYNKDAGVVADKMSASFTLPPKDTWTHATVNIVYGPGGVISVKLGNDIPHSLAVDLFPPPPAAISTLTLQLRMIVSNGSLPFTTLFVDNVQLAITK